MTWICLFLFLFTFFPKSLGIFKSYACWFNIISNLSHETSKWSFQNWYKKWEGDMKAEKKGWNVQLQLLQKEANNYPHQAQQHLECANHPQELHKTQQQKS